MIPIIIYAYVHTRVCRCVDGCWCVGTLRDIFLYKDQTASAGASPSSYEASGGNGRALVDDV